MDNIASGLENDFRDRKPKQATTSKYIQTKTATTDGGYNSESIDGTPDEKLIKPNLKTSTCETVSFDTSIFSGFPVPIPFISNRSSKEIKEELPNKDKSEYGKIQVHETRGGFVELKDETPGNKRWMKLHPAGTYSQVVNNGDMHEKIVNDRFIIIDKNWNISVGEDFIEVIVGNQKIQIKKDREVNIKGNDNKNVDGDDTTKVKGNHSTEVKGNETEKITGNMLSDITGGLTENIKKDYKRMVNGKQNVIAMGGINHISSASINIIATGQVILSSSAMVKVTAPMITLN